MKQMKQNNVGMGLVQVCPPRGNLPPPPPQLDRIIEQKVSQINLQPVPSNSPSVSPKMSRPAAQFVSPKPFVRFDDSPSTSQIRKMSSKPHGGIDSLPPPPPPEMLQPPPLPAAPAPQIPSVTPPTPPPPPPPVAQTEIVQGEPPKFDPFREFFDFLDEHEGKKLPGKLRSPFLHQEAASGKSNATARPFQEQKRDPAAPVAPVQRWSPVSSPMSTKKIPPSVPSKSVASQPIHQSTPPPPQTKMNQVGPKQLLTTDFDYVPMDDNRINNNPSTAPLNNNLPSKQVKQVSPFEKVKETPQGPVKYEQEIFELPEQQWHCHKCRQPVQPGTVAVFAERAGSDKCWHPQCFCCSICNVSITWFSIHSLGVA